MFHGFPAISGNTIFFIYHVLGHSPIDPRVALQVSTERCKAANAFYLFNIAEIVICAELVDLFVD